VVGRRLGESWDLSLPEPPESDDFWAAPPDLHRLRSRHPLAFAALALACSPSQATVRVRHDQYDRETRKVAWVNHQTNGIRRSVKD
jgi:hypothetical protein